MNSRAERFIYAAALFLAVLPLWVVGPLPMVDLPQHLHLISALHRLHDPTTLYPAMLELRPGFTPYLGYYWSVSLLHWLVPLELANRLFLSAVVLGLPLAVGFLLRSLGRPRWPSLLAVPFAYGDSFGWGFVNFLASVPLAILCCGLFVRALADVPRRRGWAATHALALFAVLAFHIQGFVFLAAALPVLLLTTRVPEDVPGRRALSARGWALVSVLPAVAVFLAWAISRLGGPSEIAPGEPWKAWGPIFSPENLAVKPFAQNAGELLSVPANLLRDGSDRFGLWAAWAVAAAAGVLGAVRGLLRIQNRGQVVWALRLPLLAAIAFALFFLLPFDIRGYVYYFNTRYAHFAWPLLLASVPALRPRARPYFLAAGLAVSAITGLALSRGFRAFGAEAAPLESLAARTPAKPLLVGLIFDPRSQVMSHPVFLHAACELARAGGGMTNFSFAGTPHSPLEYRVEPPPSFPSEWDPGAFSYERMGRAYDHYLLRGASAQAVFGGALGREVEPVAASGDFVLLRRR